MKKTSGFIGTAKTHRQRNTFKGTELYDKTLGVIGLGRIGSTVAKFAKAFGMNVIAFDPFLSKEIASNKGVEVVELVDLLKNADFITIHIPKTEETANMISFLAEVIGIRDDIYLGEGNKYMREVGDAVTEGQRVSSSGRC